MFCAIEVYAILLDYSLFYIEDNLTTYALAKFIRSSDHSLSQGSDTGVMSLVKVVCQFKLSNISARFQQNLLRNSNEFVLDLERYR